LDIEKIEARRAETWKMRRGKEETQTRTRLQKLHILPGVFFIGENELLERPGANEGAIEPRNEIAR
jgi:hypothetical protein